MIRFCAASETASVNVGFSVFLCKNDQPASKVLVLYRNSPFARIPFCTAGIRSGLEGVDFRGRHS